MKVTDQRQFCRNLPWGAGFEQHGAQLDGAGERDADDPSSTRCGHSDECEQMEEDVHLVICIRFQVL